MNSPSDPSLRRMRPRLAAAKALPSAGGTLVLTIESVVALCEQQGHSSIDAAVAERIATGAANAVRAVREIDAASLLETEPAQFRPALEQLADAES